MALKQIDVKSRDFTFKQFNGKTFKPPTIFSLKTQQFETVSGDEHLSGTSPRASAPTMIHVLHVQRNGGNCHGPNRQCSLNAHSFLVVFIFLSPYYSPFRWQCNVGYLPCVDTSILVLSCHVLQTVIALAQL